MERSGRRICSLFFLFFSFVFAVDLAALKTHTHTHFWLFSCGFMLHFFQDGPFLVETHKNPT